MKKYLSVLLAIWIFLFAPIHTYASQSEIETTVPTTHTIAIEAEHAQALYVEGDKGLSNAYPVPRFSNPQFKITVEDGYLIKRVLLNGTDVTKEIENDILTLSKVCENQVITIETEDQLKEAPQTSQTLQESENVKEAVQKQETGGQLPEANPSESDTEKEPEETGQTTSEDSIPQILEENEKHFSFWWIILLLTSAVIFVWIILLIKKRKK